MKLYSATSLKTKKNKTKTKKKTKDKKTPKKQQKYCKKILIDYKLSIFRILSFFFLTLKLKSRERCS